MSRKSDRPGVPSNLTTYRYPGDRLSASQEADLVRAAKQGDAAALDHLTKACQPMVGKLAHKYYGNGNEEIVSLLNLGLAKAIYAFDPRQNVRFGTYAYHCMEGSFLDAKKGTTAADRALFANPSASVEELIELAGYSTSTPMKAARARRLVEEALAKRVAASAEHISYDTTEKGADEDDGDKPAFVTVSNGFDSVEVWHRRRDRQITGVIQLAVWLSETAAMRELKLKGRRRYAQDLCDRDQLRGAYVEVKRASRIRSFAAIRDREWATVSRLDRSEHRRRQEPMQQCLRESEELKEAKRQERRRAIDRGVGKAIGTYLKQRGSRP